MSHESRLILKKFICFWFMDKAKDHRDLEAALLSIVQVVTHSWNLHCSDFRLFKPCCSSKSASALMMSFLSYHAKNHTNLCNSWKSLACAKEIFSFLCFKCLRDKSFFKSVLLQSCHIHLRLPSRPCFL